MSISTTDMLTTDEQRESFATLGVTIVRGLIDQYWLEAIGAGIEQVLAAPSPTANFADAGEERFFQDTNNWPRIKELEVVMRYSPLRRIAGELLGARKVNLLQDHVLVKEPGASKPTIWHQDQPYSPIDGRQFCTIWCPVDAVARDTAVEFIAGSHNWGKWFRPQQFSDSSLREGDDTSWDVLPEDVADPGTGNTVVGWSVEPGDCIAFTGLTLHGAPGNSTTTRRRVFTSRWTGDDARIHRRTGKMSPPLWEDAPADGEPLDSPQFPVVWSSAAV